MDKGTCDAVESMSIRRHSPTPWHQSATQIWSADSRLLFRCYDTVSMETGLCNVGFVVCAVNAHDALLTACKSAMDYWYHDWQGTGSKRDREVYELLTTALALVPEEKGEAP